MAKMPSYDEIRADFMNGVRTVEDRIEHPFHHAADAATQTPATQPVNLAAATAPAVTAAPQEEPVISLADLKNDVKNIGAKLESFDESALNKLNVVTANPETADVLNDLAGLGTIVGIPAGAIAGVAAGLKTLLSLYAPDQQQGAPAQAQQPAGAPA